MITDDALGTKRIYLILRWSSSTSWSGLEKNLSDDSQTVQRQGRRPNVAVAETTVNLRKS